MDIKRGAGLVVAGAVLVVVLVLATGDGGPCDREPESDHMIHACFGDWQVRHVFDRHTLEHRYSDATTVLHAGWLSESTFQINYSADGSMHYSIPKWIERVEIRVGEALFPASQNSLDTFYGPVTAPLLQAMANAQEPIQLRLISGGEAVDAWVSQDGSSAALRWIRAID